MIRLIDERIMEKLRDKPENINFVEFVALVGEWREERVQKPKCPYCVKPIERQAIKCSGCLSELEWFKFDDLYGPCTIGASEEMEGALATAKATHQAILDAAKKKNEDELAELLTAISAKKCAECSGVVFSDDRLNSISLIEARKLKTSLAKYKRCRPCQEKMEEKAVLIFVLFIFSFFALLGFLLKG